MPHLFITYTPNIEADLDALCARFCHTLISLRDDEGKPAFPPGGTRVLAYPAAHYAVADGSGNLAFMYLNLRIFGGRSAALVKRTGDSLLEVAKEVLAPVIARQPIGITLQIDETPRELPGTLTMSYEDRHNTLHALFRE